MSRSRRLLLRAAVVAGLGSFVVMEPARAETAAQSCWTGSACVSEGQCGSNAYRCTGCSEGINLVCEPGSPANGCAGNEVFIYCGFAT